jgi:ABC-type multidrug transport system fused ATPase/permease subunit
MGIIVIFIAYIQLLCWHVVAYNLCERMRSRLLQAILRQNIGWFDTHEVGELNTRLVDDVDQI